MDVERLEGKTVLVTGAGSGIGRETALLCAARGADLALCDRDEAGLADTEAAARRQGHEVLALRVDVGERGQMQEFADAVHERVEAVDLLVNNAGVGLGASFLDTTLEDWEWILPINVMGVVHGCHMFVPRMVARGRGGHVVNLSSAAGFFPNPGLSAYSATKFAVLGLSEALRIELRPHAIGVTAICPGLINTPITRTSPTRGAMADEALRARVVRLYERRNYGPERVARRILHAVSRDSPVMPVTAEAWAMYVLTRACPPLARALARALDAATK
ncbi:MAG TPA: SDR family NAD(P)-dependent oxidoreductase [Solirubrobacteraceae bacterium]|jgi:NAD(P)-dependent dehydrogenase (short-subunit alcohol dehydrogenase family)|nr:SDR family NAD(P)-dependent oxidoreductase [Solirubrobacteraceae bacterium]